MSKKKKDLYYLPIAKDEDSAFIIALCKLENVELWNNLPHYYLRFIHGKNTWNDPDHFDLKNRKKNTFYLPKESKNYLQKILNEYYIHIFGQFAS